MWHSPVFHVCRSRVDRRMEKKKEEEKKGGKIKQTARVKKLESPNASSRLTYHNPRTKTDKTMENLQNMEREKKTWSGTDNLLKKVFPSRLLPNVILVQAGFKLSCLLCWPSALFQKTLTDPNSTHSIHHNFTPNIPIGLMVMTLCLLALLSLISE